MMILPVAPGYALERKPEEIKRRRTETATAMTVSFWRNSVL